METSGTLAAFVSNINKITEGLISLIQSSETLGSQLSSTLEKGYNYISSLRDVKEEVRRTLQVHQALHDLTVAAEMAKRFIDQVGELTFHCSIRSDMMKNAQRGANRHQNLCFRTTYRPDYRPLNDLINQLQQGMLRAGNRYKEFEEASDEAINRHQGEHGTGRNTPDEHVRGT